MSIRGANTHHVLPVDQIGGVDIDIQETHLLAQGIASLRVIGDFDECALEVVGDLLGSEAYGGGRNRKWRGHAIQKERE